MSLVFVEAIRGRCASFAVLTATVWGIIDCGYMRHTIEYCDDIPALFIDDHIGDYGRVVSPKVGGAQ